jgi:hypothetical protein
MQLNSIIYRMHFKTQNDAIVFIEKKTEHNKIKQNYSNVAFCCYFPNSVIFYIIRFAAAEQFKILAGELISIECKKARLNRFITKLENKKFPVDAKTPEPEKIAEIKEPSKKVKTKRQETQNTILVSNAILKEVPKPKTSSSHHRHHS